MKWAETLARPVFHLSPTYPDRPSPIQRLGSIRRCINGPANPRPSSPILFPSLLRIPPHIPPPPSIRHTPPPPLLLLAGGEGTARHAHVACAPSCPVLLLGARVLTAAGPPARDGGRRKRRPPRSSVAASGGSSSSREAPSLVLAMPLLEDLQPAVMIEARTTRLLESIVRLHMDPAPSRYYFALSPLLPLLGF